MAHQTLAQIQSDKKYVLQKLQDAKDDLSAAYDDCKLAEIIRVIIAITEIEQDIEQNM